MYSNKNYDYLVKKIIGIVSRNSKLHNSTTYLNSGWRKWVGVRQTKNVQEVS